MKIIGMLWGCRNCPLAVLVKSHRMYFFFFLIRRAFVSLAHSGVPAWFYLIGSEHTYGYPEKNLGMSWSTHTKWRSFAQRKKSTETGRGRSQCFLTHLEGPHPNPPPISGKSASQVLLFVSTPAPFTEGKQAVWIPFLARNKIKPNSNNKAKRVGIYRKLLGIREARKARSQGGMASAMPGEPTRSPRPVLHSPMPAPPWNPPYGPLTRKPNVDLSNWATREKGHYFFLKMFVPKWFSTIQLKRSARLHDSYEHPCCFIISTAPKASLMLRWARPCRL